MHVRAFAAPFGTKFSHFVYEVCNDLNNDKITVYFKNGQFFVKVEIFFFLVTIRRLNSHRNRAINRKSQLR